MNEATEDKVSDAVAGQNDPLAIFHSMTCKECKFWGEENYEHSYNMASGENHKPCTHPKVGGGSYADDARMGDDALNSYETIGTGKDFGCIHVEI